jgi:hypothetical protein
VQVYCCRPRGNTGYTYRESIPLGVTSLSPARVRSVVAVLQVQWPGDSYDLLGGGCAQVDPLESAPACRFQPLEEPIA